MKTCVVFGNMQSDKSSEAYPTIILCEECFQELKPDTENTRIVSYDEYDESLGDCCSECQKTKEDEDNEPI
jgi:hypothetical protein